MFDTLGINNLPRLFTDVFLKVSTCSSQKFKPHYRLGECVTAIEIQATHDFFSLINTSN